MLEMKCVYRENYYGANSQGESKLVGETAEGERQSLLTKYNRGYNSMLAVDNDGYKVTEGETDEIFRQGTETHVFVIYDSLLFDPGQLLVKDGIKDVEMSFRDYENKYGYDRVQRTEKTKFYVYTESTADETAFGIVHFRDKRTLAIYSVYEPYPMTEREKTDYAKEIVSGQLQANQYGNVSAVGLPRTVGNTDVNIYHHSFAPKFEQAECLFDDAMERKETVIEQLGESGLHYERDESEEVKQ